MKGKIPEMNSALLRDISGISQTLRKIPGMGHELLRDIPGISPKLLQEDHLLAARVVARDQPVVVRAARDFLALAVRTVPRDGVSAACVPAGGKSLHLLAKQVVHLDQHIGGAALEIRDLVVNAGHRIERIRVVLVQNEGDRDLLRRRQSLLNRSPQRFIQHKRSVARADDKIARFDLVKARELDGQPEEQAFAGGNWDI